MGDVELEVNDLFVDDAGEIHRLISYCDQPTVTFESLCQKYRSNSAVGSRVANEFSNISTMNKDQLIGIIQILSDKLTHESNLMNDLKFDLADTKIKYADLRMEIVDSKLQAAE